MSKTIDHIAYAINKGTQYKIDDDPAFYVTQPTPHSVNFQLQSGPVKIGGRNGCNSSEIIRFAVDYFTSLSASNNRSSEDVETIKNLKQALFWQESKYQGKPVIKSRRVGEYAPFDSKESLQEWLLPSFESYVDVVVPTLQRLSLAKPVSGCAYTISPENYSKTIFNICKRAGEVRDKFDELFVIAGMTPPTIPPQTDDSVRRLLEKRIDSCKPEQPQVEEKEELSNSDHKQLIRNTVTVLDIIMNGCESKGGISREITIFRDQISIIMFKLKSTLPIIDDYA